MEVSSALIVPNKPETITKPNHWADGTEIKMSEVDNVWSSAKTCDSELVDVVNNWIKKVSQFADMDLILYNGSNLLVSDRIMEIATLCQQYFACRESWIRGNLDTAKKAFENYRDNNKHSCEVTIKEEFSGCYDEYSNPMYDKIPYHECGCGERAAAFCNKCK